FTSNKTTKCYQLRTKIKRKKVRELSLEGIIKIEKNISNSNIHLKKINEKENIIVHQMNEPTIKQNAEI
ncbi:hypothetical protein, partial [Bacillus mycoides]|uniref:hypothetical protein n=1 Tax=Bacillus mycoides TaxID=1405 RepID=UPI0024AE3D29